VSQLVEFPLVGGWSVIVEFRELAYQLSVGMVRDLEDS